MGRQAGKNSHKAVQTKAGRHSRQQHKVQLQHGSEVSKFPAPCRWVVMSGHSILSQLHLPPRHSFPAPSMFSPPHTNF